jgi:hypothetical protein
MTQHTQQPEPPINHCRSCGAPMIWANTVTGGAMPLDQQPSAQGNIELRLERARWRANVLSPAELELLKGQGLELRTSHFVTCPNAAEHRRRRPAR